MKSIEVLRTRGLPFSLMTTTHGLLIVADGENNDLFTYCPERGVMLGLGDFDDRPRMYTPKYMQLLIAPVEDLLRMKREWEAAAASECNTSLPFVAAMTEPVSALETEAQGVRRFESLCEVIESEDDDEDSAA